MPVHHPEISAYLDQKFNINPQTQEKFAEIVQRIFNALFLSLCQISFERNNCPGQNSHRVKGLNIQDHKDLSKFFCKMKKFSLSPKRVKLSNHFDEIHDYGQNKKEEEKAYDNEKHKEKAYDNEKQKASNNE